MYKTVPNASEYEMTVGGHIRRKDGAVCMLTILSEQPAITLVIYGKERTITVEWLRLMTHFEVDLPYRDFFNSYFTPTKEWINGITVNQTMLFYGKRPEYKPGYRIVPCYTRYAVSREGELIDTYTGKTTVLRDYPKRYLEVRIYSPDKGKLITTCLHRLVALAWVKNPNHLKYYLVNHIDGNKHNTVYTNLEWTDHKGNIEHAYKNNLRASNIGCKIRNVTTKEVKIFSAISLAASYMGLSPYRRINDIFNFKRKSYLIKGQYEIKRLDDPTPWFYENMNNPIISGRYVITVIDDKGTEEVFYNVNSLLLKYPTRCGFVGNLSRKIKRVLDVYPDIKISVTDTYVTLPIQALEIATGKVTEAISSAILAKLINLCRVAIKRSLDAGETKIYKGYSIRYKSDTEWVILSPFTKL